MGNWLRRGGLILLIVSVVLSVFWWRTMLWTGQLRPVHPHFAGTCAVAAPIVGAEDLVIDRENRMVFISSHDRRQPSSTGSIWMMPVDAPSTAKPMILPDLGGAGFAPHGLDLYVGSDGTRYLFVIDHGSKPNELVRKFAIAGDRLMLVRTFESDLFYSPNDLSVVGDNQFYMTNDTSAKAGSLHAFVTALFRRKNGNVVWVDDMSVTPVATGFAYANGIAASDDGKQLFVSGMMDQALRIYDRAPSTGELILRDQLHLGSGLDNIDVAADGSLWIGSHPRLLDLSGHAKDAAKPSPSQVFRIELDEKKVSEVYLSNGDPLHALSVAAVIDNTIFMGGVFDTSLLVCTQQKEE